MFVYYKTLIYRSQFAAALLAGLLFVTQASAEPLQTRDLPPLPEPASNNAVVVVATPPDEFLISFAGLGAGKSHEDTLATTWVYSGHKEEWVAGPPVPGGVGRLAATAAAAGQLAFVFGGYTVEEDGTEVSTPWVHAFDPQSRQFEERSPMPVPVDDAVAVTYENRYIYLISGWHDSGNVNLVQRYDAVNDLWVQATPIPGPGVFGHSGGIVGNTIAYCDGVAIRAHADRRREFAATDQCFSGTIDPEDSRRIDWRTLPAHPGAPRYRMAAVGSEELGGYVFVGGSDNPYNFNGIGYNGEPSQPSAGILLLDRETGEWASLNSGPIATMDHRALVRFAGGYVTAGGMLQGQQITNRVIVYSFDQKKRRTQGPAQSN